MPSNKALQQTRREGRPVLATPATGHRVERALQLNAGVRGHCNRDSGATVTSISVWQLQTGSDRRPWLYSDLDVFAQFRGRSRRRRWVAPEVEITAKSKPAGDGLCWSGGPPVVSEHARDVLSPLLRGHAEFLPLLTLRGRAFFVLNVTRRIDCLNEQRSAWSTTQTRQRAS